jgi:hypothetical protein
LVTGDKYWRVDDTHCGQASDLLSFETSIVGVLCVCFENLSFSLILLLNSIWLLETNIGELMTPMQKEGHIDLYVVCIKIEKSQS